MSFDARTQHDSEAVHSTSGYDITPLSAGQRETLARTLNDEEQRVILHQGTERAFCGHLRRSLRLSAL